MEEQMSNKEKLYHYGNVVAIPIGFLSGFLLGRLGRLADAGQISMRGDPVILYSSLLLWAITGISVIWILVSGLIHANRKAVVRAGEMRNFKMYAAIAIFFIILIVLSIFTPLWMIVLAGFAVYLFVISSRALITKHSTEMT